VLATIMGEQLVVGGDIILAVQGIPVGEAAEHRRVRDILDSVPPGGEFTIKSRVRPVAWKTVPVTRSTPVTPCGWKWNAKTEPPEGVVVSENTASNFPDTWIGLPLQSGKVLSNVCRSTVVPPCALTGAASAAATPRISRSRRILLSPS
jgi:hypothetical protein